MQIWTEIVKISLGQGNFKSFLSMVGLTADNLCPLYNALDCPDHIFFSCPFLEITERIILNEKMINENYLLTMDHLVFFIKEFSDSSIHNILASILDNILSHRSNDSF